ncbi:hypothetical protein EON77_02685, partial [bacterium]
MTTLRALTVVAPTLLATLAAAQARPNQTILRPEGMLPGETADAYVNGVRVGTLRGHVSVDISRYVKPGANRLTIKWAKPISIITANVGYAAEPNRFAAVGRVHWNSVAFLRKPGSRSITFRIPDPAHPVGASKPTYGSTARQTILKVTDWVEPQSLEAFVNGKSVGDLSSKATIDVTDMVRPGRNTLKLVWKGPAQYFGVKVAYAKTPNVFGDAGQIRMIA